MFRKVELAATYAAFIVYFWLPAISVWRFALLLVPVYMLGSSIAGLGVWQAGDYGFRVRVAVGALKFLDDFRLIPRDWVWACAAVIPVVAGNIGLLWIVPGVAERALIIPGRGYFIRFVEYIPEAIAQQMAIAWLVHRLEECGESAIRCGAWCMMLFAFLHLPNPVLTPVTAMNGFLIGWALVVFRNLYVTTFAHAVVGSFIALTVPDSVLRCMLVGFECVQHRWPH